MQQKRLRTGIQIRVDLYDRMASLQSAIGWGSPTQVVEGCIEDILKMIDQGPEKATVPRLVRLAASEQWAGKRLSVSDQGKDGPEPGAVLHQVGPGGPGLGDYAANSSPSPEEVARKVAARFAPRIRGIGGKPVAGP